MTHDLLHGDVAAAVADDVFLLVGLPLVALWFAVRWRLGRRLLPIPAIALFVVAAADLDRGAQPARIPAGPDSSRRVATDLR